MKEQLVPFFEVFGMSQPGIEPATSRSQSGCSTTEPLCRYQRQLNQQPPDHQSDADTTEPPSLGRCWWFCCFISLSTSFKSSLDDGRMIMKGSVQWSIIQSWAEIPSLMGFKPKALWSEVRRTNHSGAPMLNPSLAEHDMPCLSKQCSCRSVGFIRSQLIWICTVCH